MEKKKERKRKDSSKSSRSHPKIASSPQIKETQAKKITVHRKILTDGLDQYILDHQSTQDFEKSHYKKR